MRHRGTKRRRILRTETLEIRRCLAASLGWDGPGQGSAELTYYVGAAPAGLSQAAVDSAIESALDAWSDVIDVEFTETSRPNQRDSIDFSFRRLDGSGGTLAQAYLPDDVNPSRIAGDVEFDSSEQWEIGNQLGRSAFDLVRVAVHEIGHALGVDHLNVSGAVMAPFVSPSATFTGLRTADVDAALALYGAATTNSTTESNTTDGTTTNNTTDTTTPADTPDTNRDWRPWHRFWWWRNRWFGSRLVASPAQHNPIMPADVNQDGNVTTRDALAILNQLIGPDGAEGESSMLADTNGDGDVSPGDALFVVNEVARINAGGSPTVNVFDEFDLLDNVDTESGDVEVMDDMDVETETEMDETETGDTETGDTESGDGTPSNEETDDDLSPADDTDPVDDPNTVDDTTPTTDTPSMDDPPPVDDTTPVDDPNTVDDTTPTTDTPTADGPPPVDDMTPVDDPNTVDDTTPTTDTPTADGPPPVDDMTPVDDPNTVDDTTPTDDTPTDDTPPLGDTPMTDDMPPVDDTPTTADDGDPTDDMVHCPSFGRHRNPGLRLGRFASLDDNGDGMVTEDEVNADLWERISPADVDGNGVTAEELASYRDTLPPKRFTRLDDNSDGLITEDEVNEMIWTVLVGSDTNGDAAISLEEFSGAMLFVHRGGSSRFTSLDDNGDGMITEDEVNADLWERISPADLDGNGVTAEELASYRDSLPPKRFTRLDDNSDGLITEDEVNEMIWTVLVNSDTDGDSAISPEEFPESRSFGHRGGHHGFQSSGLRGLMRGLRLGGRLR